MLQNFCIDLEIKLVIFIRAIVKQLFITPPIVTLCSCGKQIISYPYPWLFSFMVSAICYGWSYSLKYLVGECLLHVSL